MSHAYPPNPALYYANNSKDLVDRHTLLKKENRLCIHNGERVPATLLFPCCNGTMFDEISRTCVNIPQDNTCGKTRAFAGGWTIDVVSPSKPLFRQDELYPDVAYDLGTACQPNNRGSLFNGVGPSAGEDVTSSPTINTEALEQYNNIVYQKGPLNELQFPHNDRRSHECPPPHISVRNL